MQTAGLAGFVKKRKHRATVSESADQVFPDLPDLDFTAEAPNQRYVGDITYLPLSEAGGGGNLYLATVIDCYSRRLMGWAVADHMRTDLVADALKAAAATRGSLAGAIFHSDHGSVYTSKAYAEVVLSFLTASVHLVRRPSPELTHPGQQGSSAARDCANRSLDPGSVPRGPLLLLPRLSQSPRRPQVDPRPVHVLPHELDQVVLPRLPHH
jgi:transposase InsO family protein